MRVVITLVVAMLAREALAGPAATVVAVDDEARVRRADCPDARGQALPASGGEIALVALRGETVAFQVIAVAGERPIANTALSVAPLAGPGAPLRPELFREHYLTVARRSFNDRRPDESPGWLPAARPPDDEMRGELPDALIPVALDPGRVAPGPAVPAGRTGAFWVDVFVPESAAQGDYVGSAELAGDGASLARFQVRVRVLAPVLPYRATSVFMFYEADRLGKRLGDAAAGPAERRLWQLLHAHHIDALAPLASAAEAERLAPAYDGSLFRAGAGYDGPGAGLPPQVVALGTYGVLGAPGPASLARVDALLARLPRAALGSADLFLYAIDEQCRSLRAGDWKRAFAARPAAGRVAVGQTCDDPPATQAADIVMLPAGAFTRDTAAAARAAGRRAWIYNGQLPRTGSVLLDADPRGLVANGWIAAAAAIERWFYWESIFWDDDNRGGRGPIDPFVTAESFHNGDGDTALGDGLLLYPGRQRPPFVTHSLDTDAVLPSLRLKALRRGIEDAGIIALAARERPDEVGRIVAEALPRALDEARPDQRASWEVSGRRFSDARAALRALIRDPAPISAAEIRAVFADLAARRRQTIAPAPTRRAVRLRRLAALLGGLTVLVALGFGAYVRRHRLDS